METNDKRFAGRMNALLMIQVIGQTSVNFLNRKKLTRELTGHIKTLLGDDPYGAQDVSSGETGASDLDEFAEFFIDSCLNSKAYGTTFFGVVPMSGEGVKTRLLQDIEEITVTIPSRFGLENECAPIREALTRAYERKTGKSL